MLNNKQKITLILTCVIAIIVPQKAQSIWIPSADTATDTDLSASFDGGTFSKLLGQANTETFATAFSSISNTQTPIPGTNLHNASSSAQMALPQATSATLFQSAYHSHAESLTPEPLFSKAAATGQGSLIGVVTGSETPSSASPFLDLSWHFNTFNLQSTPTASFSYISDTVNIVQQSLANPEIATVTSIGYYLAMENGKLTTRFSGPSGAAQHIESWFENNLNVSLNNLSLKPNTNPLSIQIPILDRLDNDQVVIAIENQHTEYSIEAPPSATFQVGEKMGNFNHDGTPVLHWDTETGTLTFDPIPINFLGSNSSNQFNEKFIDDPLNGGILEIDPLTLTAETEKGEYFSGDEIRLIDNNGHTIFKASLPSLIFDNGLFDQQQYNLFAPLLNFLEVDTGNSPWLQNYMSKIDFDSLLIPELFIGFGALNSNRSIWEQDFYLPAKAFLSFGGITANVTEPASLMLLSFGFLTLVWIRQRKYRFNSRP